MQQVKNKRTDIAMQRKRPDDEFRDNNDEWNTKNKMEK